MMLLGAITLSLQLQRTTFDLLDGLNVEVAAHNSNKAPVSVRFTQPFEYAIDVLRGNNVVWTSQAQAQMPSVTIPPHARQLMPGPTVLAVYIWDETTKDGASIAPGDYTVRARLLGVTEKAQASMPVHFISPTPISALPELHPGDEVTIAGRLDQLKTQLTDSSGTMKLSRRLSAAEGPVAVRGYLTTQFDRSRIFFVQRWAPLGN